MSKNLLVAGFLFGSILLIGIFLYHSPFSSFLSPASPSETNSVGSNNINPTLQYRLGDCKTSNFQEAADALDVTATTDGKINFNQRLTTYCNVDEDTFTINLESKGNRLVAKETINIQVATKCTCPLQITGEISGLKKNQQYHLEFWLENNYTNQQENLYTTSVSL